MMKLIIGLLAALVIAAGRLFRLRILRAAAHRAPMSRRHSPTVRASGAKASHGKVAFDLWSRTVTIADIAGEFAAQTAGQREDWPRSSPPGVSQPEAGRFAASRIEAADVEASRNHRHAGRPARFL